MGPRHVLAVAIMVAVVLVGGCVREIDRPENATTQPTVTPFPTSAAQATAVALAPPLPTPPGTPLPTASATGTVIVATTATETVAQEYSRHFQQHWQLRTWLGDLAQEPADCRGHMFLCRWQSRPGRTNADW